MNCGCSQSTSGGYHLVKPDGSVLTDAAGAALVFATRAEADAARARHGGTVTVTTEVIGRPAAQ